MKAQPTELDPPTPTNFTTKPKLKLLSSAPVNGITDESLQQTQDAIARDIVSEYYISESEQWLGHPKNFLLLADHGLQTIEAQRSSKYYTYTPLGINSLSSDQGVHNALPVIEVPGNDIFNMNCQPEPQPPTTSYFPSHSNATLLNDMEVRATRALYPDDFQNILGQSSSSSSFPRQPSSETPVAPSNDRVLYQDNNWYPVNSLWKPDINFAPPAQVSWHACLAAQDETCYYHTRHLNGFETVASDNEGHDTRQNYRNMAEFAYEEKDVVGKELRDA